MKPVEIVGSLVFVDCLECLECWPTAFKILGGRSVVTVQKFITLFYLFEIPTAPNEHIVGGLISNHNNN